jgi:hypothetical protein
MLIDLRLCSIICFLENHESEQAFQHLNAILEVEGENVLKEVRLLSARAHMLKASRMLKENPTDFTQVKQNY